MQSHLDTITTLAVSPTNGILLSGSWDQTVKVWDVEKRQPIKTVLQDAPVRGIAFSRDHRRLFVGTHKGLSVWSCETWTRLNTFSNFAAVFSVVLSPDGAALAITGQNSVRILDSETYRELANLPTEGRWFVYAPAFSPDSSKLAYGKSENVIALWDLKEQRAAAELVGHEGVAQAIAFNRDGSKLVSGGFDQTIRVWEIASQKQIVVHRNFSSFITQITLSPNAKTIVVATGDQQVRLYETETWQEVSSLTGHMDEVMAVAFAHDGNTFFTGSKDTAIKCWSTALNGNRESRSIPSRLSFYWPSGADNLILRDTNHTIRLLSFASLEESPAYTLPTTNSAFFAFSPRGGLWASRIAPGQVKVYKFVTGEFVAEFTYPGPISRLFFSRDGEILMSIGVDQVCRLSDVASGKELHAFPLHPGYVRFFEFSRSNRLLGIVYDPSGLTEVWETRSGLKLASIRSKTQQPFNLSFSRDDKLLAAVGSHGKIELWNLQTQKQLAVFGRQLSTYDSVAFSSDDRRVAACGRDGAVDLWDTETFQEVASVKLQAHPVEGLDFLEDSDDTLVAFGHGHVFVLRAPWAELKREFEPPKSLYPGPFLDRLAP